MTPIMSVLMPVFNDAEYVQDAVESILDQSFTDFELVVVNDGSTDETPDILKSAAGRDERIRLYHQENRGISSARNRLIEEARGQFLVNMDGDDVSASERLESQIQYLHQHPDVDVVGTQMAYIGPTGRPTGRPATTTPTDAASIAWQLLFGMCVFHPTWCARREALQSEIYSSNYNVAEDYELISRLSRRHIIANLDLPLYKVRESPSRISNERSQEQASIARSVMHREHQSLLGYKYNHALSEALSQGREIDTAGVRYAIWLATRLADRNGYGVRQRAIILRRLYDRIACASNTTILHKAAVLLLGSTHQSLYSLRASFPVW